MLTVKDLHLAYRSDQGIVRAIRGISFSVGRGQFYTLLGPSGCGKTSTLRCVAGLETPLSGEIEIGSDVVYSSVSGRVVSPNKRNIGMVFQSYAIWPHMSVFDNVAFPLVHGSQKLPRQTVRDKVMQALSLVQLDSMADRPAPNLSGGQQQRVALARAIVREPSVLLLDEPLSNLDARLREDMRQQIKSLVRRLDITTLYVTHDQLEALSMSDTVALVRDGEIVQEGSPREVYHRPSDAFAASFLGHSNLLDGQVISVSDDGGRVRIETSAGRLDAQVSDALHAGDPVTLGFHPEALEVLARRPAESENVLEGTVAAATFAGDVIEYEVQVGDRLIRARGQAFATLDEGQAAFLRAPADRCYVLAAH
jgi:iron(III) transport system ATP-binding protein